MDNPVFSQSKVGHNVHIRDTTKQVYFVRLRLTVTLSVDVEVELS